MRSNGHTIEEPTRSSSPPPAGGAPFDEASALELGGRMREVLEQAATLVRDRPVASLLIAAGAGYLIGRALRA